MEHKKVNLFEIRDRFRQMCNLQISQNIPTNIWRSLFSSIDEGTLDVVYQPIVNHSKCTVFAHEVLSRPQYVGQLIPPNDWFRAAYKCGLSVVADLLALSAGVTNLRMFPSEIKSTPIFVNVMPSSLVEKSFLEGLELIFHEGTCQPKQLVLEIIEYVSYDPRSLLRIIAPIRSLGVQIALDDVGVGNTNLAALVKLEPDFIKIDRSLIEDISVSSSKQRLLSQLVGYMESGDSVIAEGVENSEDLLAIQEAGANLSQGYYWARPMPANDLTPYKWK